MKIFILFISIVLLSSCNSDYFYSKKSIQKTNIEIDSTIIQFDTLKNKLSEKNLKKQLKEFIIAFNTGDADMALSYIYPDVFEYLKEAHPDEYVDIEKVKQVLIIETMNQLKINS